MDRRSSAVGSMRRHDVGGGGGSGQSGSGSHLGWGCDARRAGAGAERGGHEDVAVEVLNLEEDAAAYTGRAIPRDIDGMSREIRELARARNAVILAHNYQVPEVQDVADYVGDSLGLSRHAPATQPDMIVFSGLPPMPQPP